MAIHTMPVKDNIEHKCSFDCECEPIIEFFHPDTGEAYTEALVIHNRIMKCDISSRATLD